MVEYVLLQVTYFFFLSLIVYLLFDLSIINIDYFLGCPLSESDLTPLPTLASQIKQFLIKIHLETNIKEKKEDDLYDF